MLLGCQSQGAPAHDPTQAPTPAPIQAVTAAPPSASVAPSPDAAVAALPDDAGAAPVASSAPSQPWPFSELPLRDDAMGMFGGRRGGFSSDDRYLGYEISTCDPCPSEFVFETPRGRPLTMSYYYAPAAHSLDDEAKHDAQVNKRLRELGVRPFLESRALRGPFPYPDITFASKTERAPDDSVTLFFGGHLPNEAPVYPMKITIAPHPMRAVIMKDKELLKLPPAEREKERTERLEGMTVSDPVLVYANVTKDGRDIGIVAISSGTFSYEAAATSRMQTSVFVQKVRDETKARATRRSP